MFLALYTSAATEPWAVASRTGSRGSKAGRLPHGIGCSQDPAGTYDDLLPGALDVKSVVRVIAFETADQHQASRIQEVDTLLEYEFTRAGRLSAGQFMTGVLS